MLRYAELKLVLARENAVRHRVIVCTTCLAANAAEPRGDALVAALRGAFADDPVLADFSVEAHECLSACAQPNALSFRAEGKAVYLFSGVDPVADRDDIAAFARLYVAAPDGWIEDARPAGRLRFCLVGRIPA
jgi:predicted metal-binding protein